MLAEILAVAVRTFPWPKSMRWGSGRLTWVRPLHSIIATFGPETEEPEVVAFAVDGTQSVVATGDHPGAVAVDKHGRVYYAGADGRIREPAQTLDFRGHLQRRVFSGILAGGGTGAQGFKVLDRKYLLVEDEAPVREVVRRALLEKGYAVSEAGSVAEAVRLFEQAKGAFDLVLTDMVLPDKTGVQLIDELRAGHPALPVMVMSGYTDGKSHRTAIQRKDFPFLQKPVSAKDLLKSVRTALNDRTVPGL